MTNITNFNIRVYGLIINSKGQILVSTEQYKAHTLKKFIGGGLEKGEGIKSALKREFREETGCEINVGSLYYINDFFQASFFKPEDQIISIYYFVEPENWVDFEQKINSNHLKQEFTWHNLNNFKTDILSLPIDKVVVKKLMAEKNPA